MNDRFDIEYIHDLLHKNDIEPGLYIIATPIGNLSDITIRALNVLSISDLVYCEDTRVSKKLTSKYGIKCKLKSFHKFNSRSSINEVIQKLENNEVISLISDAGTPLISDPGFDLIQKCFENNINIYSIPGPTSVIASLVVSGISSDKFTFLGFFPRNNKYKKDFIDEISKSYHTTIFYESPKRVKKTLECLKDHINERKVSVIRELTKKYEQVIHGDIFEVLKKLDDYSEIKGEITIVVESYNQNINSVTDSFLINRIKSELKNNISLSQVSLKLSTNYNVSKRRVYQLGLTVKDIF